MVFWLKYLEWHAVKRLHFRFALYWWFRKVFHWLQSPIGIIWFLAEIIVLPGYLDLHHFYWLLTALALFPGIGTIYPEHYWVSLSLATLRAFIFIRTKFLLTQRLASSPFGRAMR